MDVNWGALSFEEAIKYFMGKVPMTMEQFLALEEQAKIRAFSVSGVTGIDALSSIQASIEKALEDGLGQLAVHLIAARKTAAAHLRRRLHAGDGVAWVHDQERAVVRA